jgi:type-F conjugative transfer system pilin assembly protein TrbC
MLRLVTIHLRARAVLLFLLIFSAFNSAFADQPSTPNALDISQKAVDQAAQFKTEAFDFSQLETSQAVKKTQQAFSQLEHNNPVLPSMPKLDLMSIPTPRVDINNLVQQGQQLMGRIEEQPDRYESQILVFVSSSMPTKTIQNYLQQTAKIDAAIVFRGLINNSMLEMRKYMVQILEKLPAELKPAILIDPTLFDRFNIQQVPVTLVTESQIKPCQKMPCPTPVYHAVTGDVSLPWALALVSRQSGSDGLKSRLRPLVKELEQYQ